MIKKNVSYYKRIFVILTGVMLIGLFSGCSASDESPSVFDEKEPESTDEPDDNLTVTAEDCYREVLLENGQFISTDLNQKQISLENIGEAVTDDESLVVSAAKFAIVDLTGNGENDVVLWLQVNNISDYGFEVLSCQDNMVYGYTLPYRAFMNLKVDGTFTYSDGAADSGIGKLELSKTGYSLEKLAYSESQYNSDNELEVHFFADGETCSEEEFNSAFSGQEDKADVIWYELTEDSVNMVFGFGSLKK